MKRIFAFFVIVLSLPANSQTVEDRYIQRFAPYAVEEMELYKIPASITLAQGLLETAGGRSRLAVEANNHFGIKCKEEWTGKTMKHTDDAPDECFRAYDSERDSYRDHSVFLKTRAHYAFLFLLGSKDYKAWAYGLRKAGYATSRHYPSALIERIERYQLYKFDKTDSKEVYETLLVMYPELGEDSEFTKRKTLAQNGIDAEHIENPGENTSYVWSEKTESSAKDIPSEKISLDNVLIKSHSNGGLKFIVLPEGFDLSAISKKFGISEKRLKRYNDLEGEKLKGNQILFLENKKHSGNEHTYVTKAGESMYDISQKFGIKLKELYRKNRMKPGEKPDEWQVIYLDSRKPKN